jgi:hypothetical protein
MSPWHPNSILEYMFFEGSKIKIAFVCAAGVCARRSQRMKKLDFCTKCSVIA